MIFVIDGWWFWVFDGVEFYKVVKLILLVGVCLFVVGIGIEVDEKEL